MSLDVCPFCDRRFWGRVVRIVSKVSGPGAEWHKLRFAHPECWARMSGESVDADLIDFHIGLSQESMNHEWRGPMGTKTTSPADDAKPNHVRDAVRANS